MAASLALRDARILTPDGWLEGDLLLEGERIRAVGRVGGVSAKQDRGLSGALVLPGLIDLQVNGLGGEEVFGAPRSRLRRILGAAPATGCTGLLLTLVSAPRQIYEQLFRELAGLEEAGGARLLGIHLEGPYVNPEYRGAHPAAFVRPPDVEEARWLLQASGGSVRLWTLAPELPGAGALVELLLEQGVVTAAGHSGLGAEAARDWLDDGVRLVTHLFNAMPRLHHRHPGLAGAALAHPSIHFTLIADGHHVHPDLVRLAARLGEDRLVLITDATAAAAAPPGAYTLAGCRVISRDGRVELPGGRLAGSSLTALHAVRNLASWLGWPLEAAWLAMSERPAALLGREDLGRLVEGALADFVVLDSRGELHETWVGGRRVEARPSSVEVPGPLRASSPPARGGRTR